MNKQVGCFGFEEVLASPSQTPLTIPCTQNYILEVNKKQVETARNWLITHLQPSIDECFPESDEVGVFHSFFSCCFIIFHYKVAIQSIQQIVFLHCLRMK